MPVHPSADLDPERALAGIGWLAGASPEARAILLRGASMRRYRSQQLLFRRGDNIGSLAVVVSGRLELGLIDSEGRRFVAAYVPPGEAVGFISMLDGRGALHNAQAAEASTILRLTKDDVLAAMQSDVRWLQTVLLMLLGRSRRLNEWRSQSSMLSLGQRLARTLSSLAGPFGSSHADSDGSITLRMTQDDLAALLGVTRQALHAELKALERLGYVQLAYGRIILCKPADLRALAQPPS